MFAVAARARRPLGDRQHRLHGDHHAGFQHRVDILAQFQPRLAAVVMRKHPEGMAIAEGPVLQKLPVLEEGIDLRRHLRTARAGSQQAHPQLMRRHIRLPDPQACRVHLAQEHRPFKRSVIARNHREGVEAEDVANRQRPRRHRVMRAVGVDPGLEPDPGVAIFRLGEALRDLKLHRVTARHRHVDLARALLHRLADGVTAHVGHIRAVRDQRDLRR